MGRKAKIIKLSPGQKVELEIGYRTGIGVFSRRCHMILLKSNGKTSKEVADILGTNQISVNGWVKRYESQGITGLQTQAGRGRKPILDKKLDREKVEEAVKKERQRLKKVKGELEKDLGKQFSMKTLHRFLKSLSANGNVFD